MKPDGDATVRAEPTEALEAELEVEAAASEEQPQQDQNSSPPQPKEPENINEAPDSTAAPPDKEANGRKPDPKNKTKAPVKTRLGPSGTKATTMMGTASRPGATQNRAANSLTRTTANGAAKRPAQSELKKAAPARVAAQVKRGPPTVAVVQKTQVKAAEQKPGGTSRPAAASVNSGPSPATSTLSTLNKKPAAAANSAAPKPKTTATRPATASAVKPSIAASSKAAPVPKTARPATAPVPRSTTSSVPVKPTTKPTASRTAASAPPTARSASSQPSKFSATTAAVKKDVGKPSSSAAARKPLASSSTTTARPTAAKTSKPEVTKPATAAKRLPADTKRTQTRSDDSRPIPTRKVTPSPRNTPLRPASSRTATASNSPKQGGSSTPVSLKHKSIKPTQSVLPLVIKREPAEERPLPEPVEPSTASVDVDEHAVSGSSFCYRAAAESVPELQLPLEEQPDQQSTAPTESDGDWVRVGKLPASEPSDVKTVPNMAMVGLEPLGVQLVAESPVSLQSGPVEQEAHKCDDYIAVVASTAQEVLPPEPVTTSAFELPVAATVPPKGIDAAEKAEQLIHNDEDEKAEQLIHNDAAEKAEQLIHNDAAEKAEQLIHNDAAEKAEQLIHNDEDEKAEQLIHNDEDEEEEKEGSQQVSVSDMSGTQPTEESRPGSAGLTGSVWRAGGVASELDSEDVSCSQQGGSELSAPGVLEGTESIDDLGDASLKGADGEGASAGSPDFERVPDIPANEDDDDEDDDYDRVYDMEVGSERAEDLHRQCHDNEDEDEDVEMASEGITESGLESYGNADEDDFAEDYRLDNLNRMQAPPIVPLAPPAAQWGQANLFADPWVQPLQPDPAPLSSPPSNPWQQDSETPTQAPAQAWLEVGNAEGGPSSPHPPAFMDPTPSSSQHVPVHATDLDACLKPGLAPSLQNVSHSSTLSGPELLAHSCSDTSTPEELKDYSISPGLEDQQQQSLPVNPAPVALPDIMQDLGICLQHADEELKTLPADDVLGGLRTAPTSAASSSSSATREASDTEGEMQISEPTAEPVATGHECFSSTQVAPSFSVLQEREEACVEMEGGGGSDTPQSATSAASYGFDCTSNSNAQSTTESCAKSPGIFSLENEEQLPDEAKDPSLIKELTLTPTGAPGDVDLLNIGQQGEPQPKPEHQYMLCGKASEEMPESCSLGPDVPTEGRLTDTSSSENREDDWDHSSQHPYYSTVCEKTDSSLAGRNLCFLQEMPTIDLQPRLRPHVDHITHLPHLPVSLNPRAQSTGTNAQLRRLERHQQKLWEIEQRHEQQSRRAERREEEEQHKEVLVEEAQEGELKESELENQRRHLLQLQLQQEQKELEQRQQIMQWQQELEQRNKHQNKQQKAMTTVLLSPSGLCTIYEALEPSEAEDDYQGNRKVEEMVIKEKAEMTECERSIKGMSSDMETHSSSPKNNASGDDSLCDWAESIKDQAQLNPPAALEQPPLTPSHLPQWPCPPELDWSKKVDIVQQLINQTLLLSGDGCPPLLLTSAGGTLSPLETSLWPDLLPPITPTSATVTCVSSFSPEASGSSPQGEWTVVEVETHH